MYEERRDSFSFRDIILQFLFVALFIFILIWLFPTKNYVTNYVDGAIESAVKDSLDNYEFGGGINSEAFSNQLFNQNVMMMKDAAKDYFTLSRLPEKTGNKVKITLKEMLNEKIILPFVDSNGASCDLEESYVLVTKADTEYLMKVNLKCSDYEDYLMVHMGCYDYCSTTICETKTPSNPSKGGQPTPTPNPTPTPTPTPAVYEYEYQLVVDGKWGEWSEWSEWTQNIISKTDYREVETKVEKVSTGYVDVVDGTTTEKISASENITYTCPEKYVLNGTKCIKENDVKESLDATAKTTYFCPDSSYSLSGSYCYKVIDNSKTVDATQNINYTCPIGYYLNGQKCYKNSNYTDTISATIKTSLSCPDGYDLLGKVCSKQIPTKATATTSYTCPSGYDRINKKTGVCYKDTISSVAATKTTSYTDWTYSTQITTKDGNLQSTNTVKYVFVGSKLSSSCTSPCTNTYLYTYNVFTRKATNSYECPDNSYELKGSTCYKTTTTSTSANKTTNYSCPDNSYELKGSTCYKPSKIYATSSTSASCPTGYFLTNNGSQCSKNVSDVDVISASSSITYTCPTGYNRIGLTCVDNESVSIKLEAFSKTTYTCPNDTYTLNGNKCIKVNSVTDKIDATKNITYTCPNDTYTLNGNTCERKITTYKKEETFKEVTYYRSRTRQYIEGKIDIKWSRSQNDLSLIKQGYTLTGKQRQV